MRFKSQQLKRFFNPKTIAIYGGSWAENVIQQLQKSAYQGEIWPVHPSKKELGGVACFASSDALPGPPDAAFIGVNRIQSVVLVGQLQQLGAGGVICFASGFSETNESGTNQGCDLQNQLITAANNMPLLGPNCYGFLNYLDNVSLWPDQHGGHVVERGVAIIAQSSNVAINITMQKRRLSLAYLFTVGNQGCMGINELAEYALNDPRVSAIGLFIEGFGDLRDFQSIALKAKAARKSIVALKLGKSEQAKQATMTHTATLAGGAIASSALFERLGIVEVDSLSCLIETLKLLDVIGPLSGNKITSVSCSGGEASLMADSAHGTMVEFPDLNSAQKIELGSLLGEKVSLANPLDYHTYVWGDVHTMTECFACVMGGNADLNIFVLDIPRSDNCDIRGHRCAIDAVINAKIKTNAKVAVIASLPENIDENICDEFHQAGIVVLHGLEPGLLPVTSAMMAGRYLGRASNSLPVYQSPANSGSRGHLSRVLTEADAKAELASYGVLVPESIVLKTKDSFDDLSPALHFPLALKGLGVEHKSENGAVVLNIQSSESLKKALVDIPDHQDGYLIEQMVQDALVEIIVGVTLDESGMMLLTIGSGGVLTELLTDSVSIVMPVNEQEIDVALSQLKINRLIDGYRGSPRANRIAIVNNISAIQAYALDHADQLIELDVNPLIVRARDCYAVDALIRLS